MVSAKESKREVILFFCICLRKDQWPAKQGTPSFSYHSGKSKKQSHQHSRCQIWEEKGADSAWGGQKWAEKPILDTLNQGTLHLPNGIACSCLSFCSL